MFLNAFFYFFLSRLSLSSFFKYDQLYIGCEFICQGGLFQVGAYWQLL